MNGCPEVTVLLKAWSAGDRDALDRLTPLVYQELRRIAQHYAARERSGQTLQATALVNEAYLKMVDSTRVEWQDRAHFFAVSAQIMRRILVDAARMRDAGKRGGGAAHLALDQILVAAPERDGEVMAVDQALEELAQFDARKAQVVELRFFGGLSVAETAEVLKLSEQSVLRDWKLARAWLIERLGAGQ
jgi:RNA polymerase sigma-70 factor (ECF subfamily)